MSSAVEIRVAPLAGTPQVLSAVDDICAAARALAGGTGWLAVDTERASAFRYDDRAFLLQFRRRGAGTFLIDPEQGRAAMSTLGSQINGLTWIIHAAQSDLPSLAALGLWPKKIIDTELAGRLLGLERVNLAAMTESLLGVGLAKGHGRENWSTRPLPADWLDYAALDVELLIELAEVLTQALAERDRLAWLEEECAHEMDKTRKYKGGLHVDYDWHGLKGVGTLRLPEQLSVARAVWNARDTIARKRDVSPTHVLPHSVVHDIAQSLPRTPGQISAIRGFPRRRRGATEYWLRVVNDARHTPRESWPQPERSSRTDVASFRHWPQKAPEAVKLFEATRAATVVACAALSLCTDVLVTTAQTRELIWWMHTRAKKSTAYRSHGRYAEGLPTVVDIAAHLSAEGFRPWQARLLADVIGGHVLAPMRQPL